MKKLRFLAFLAALSFVAVHAAEDKAIVAVRAADAARLSAVVAGDRARLDAVLSDELRYAHSSGKVDSKASYIQSLVSHAIIYQSFDYKEQIFKVAGPGVVTMAGRVVIKAINKGAPEENDLNYLAIWREENGKWRFFGWQSCKLPPPAAAPEKK